MSDPEDARKRLEGRVARAFEAAHKDFQAEYAHAIHELSTLSPTDLDALVPGGEAPAICERLIAVVQEASRVNLAQADLKRRIEALGAGAIRLARLAPTLGAFL